MVFKKREANGEIDSNINRAGRPEKAKKITRREAKDKELLSLARKLKPNIAPSIREALRILNDSEAKDAEKLKASALFLKTYQDVLNQLYSEDKNEGSETTTAASDSDALKDVPEIQPQDNRPIFSLRMIKGAEDLEKE